MVIKLLLSLFLVCGWGSFCELSLITQSNILKEKSKVHTFIFIMVDYSIPLMKYVSFLFKIENLLIQNWKL